MESINGMCLVQRISQPLEQSREVNYREEIIIPKDTRQEQA